MIKKVLLVALIGLFGMFSVGCSSDDSGSNNGSNGTEQGVSKDTKIKTPTWVQGQWTVVADGTNTIGYIVKPNDFCTSVAATMCYQSMIDQASRISPDAVSVEQEYSEGYYRLSINVTGVGSTYVFRQKEGGNISITIDSGMETLLKRK
ncbi:hypothetical protein [Myroides pelagicus]|uniref:Lipocalin-like domain-containing protein n=1 Tax=Myroides pelagicus TaxID=270914 RepID=A0A7K1GLY6_9FLAO|nr:hypothetical protein [Myroides pelagicus]MEC4114192.1 hypothetical protein [Myroides pelagicus]MTH29750.1 hypothetical protein [Myroides pelagicus]